MGAGGGHLKSASPLILFLWTYQPEDCGSLMTETLGLGPASSLPLGYSLLIVVICRPVVEDLDHMPWGLRLWCSPP